MAEPSQLGAVSVGSAVHYFVLDKEQLAAAKERCLENSRRLCLDDQLLEKLRPLAPVLVTGGSGRFDSKM